MAVGRANGGFLSKFQGIASIAIALFIMLGAVWGLAYNALSNRIETIERNRFTAGEFAQYRERVDHRLAVLDATQLRLSEQIVPRGEHGEKWRANDAAFAGQQRQIDEVRRDINAIFPTTKVMDELLKRIDRLESGKIGSVQAR